MGLQTDQSAQVVLELPAQPASVTKARFEVQTFLERLAASSEEIGLAVSEAVGNAVEHAFRGREPGTIALRLEVLVPDTLVVSVLDNGVGMAPDHDSQGLGYGLALIGWLSDGFEVNSAGRGTEIKMRFALMPAAEADGV